MSRSPGRRKDELGLNQLFEHPQLKLSSVRRRYVYHRLCDTSKAGKVAHKREMIDRHPLMTATNRYSPFRDEMEKKRSDANRTATKRVDISLEGSPKGLS